MQEVLSAAFSYKNEQPLLWGVAINELADQGNVLPVLPYPPATLVKQLKLMNSIGRTRAINSSDHYDLQSSFRQVKEAEQPIPDWRYGDSDDSVLFPAG